MNSGRWTRVMTMQAWMRHGERLQWREARQFFAQEEEEVVMEPVRVDPDYGSGTPDPSDYEALRLCNR